LKLKPDLHRDLVWAFTWAYGANTLDTYFEGYSASFLSNTTIRGLLTSVKVMHRLQPYTTDRSNQNLKNWNMKVTLSGGTYEDITMISGNLAYAQKNVWYDSFKIVSNSTLNGVKAGNRVDRIRQYLTVDWYWAASGQICTEYLGVRYCW